MILIDFEDSFTFNIVSCFYEQGVELKVIKWDQIDTYCFDQEQVIIWGPGPGHPDEYLSKIKDDLVRLLFDQNKTHLGICLGHQLILKLLGCETIRCTIPIHGQNIAVSLPDWNVFPQKMRGTTCFVQRYNSLTVSNENINELQVAKNLKVWTESSEVFSVLGDNFLTYQFHPESVGTSCPEVFIEAFLHLVYNGKDAENKGQSRRHLR